LNVGLQDAKARYFVEIFKTIEKAVNYSILFEKSTGCLNKNLCYYCSKLQMEKFLVLVKIGQFEKNFEV